jgi:hypothetical protein
MSGWLRTGRPEFNPRYGRPPDASVAKPSHVIGRQEFKEATAGNPLTLNNSPASFNWVPELDTCAPLPFVCKESVRKKVLAPSYQDNKNSATFSIFFVLFHVKDNIHVIRVSSSVGCSVSTHYFHKGEFSYTEMIISPLILIFSSAGAGVAQSV